MINKYSKYFINKSILITGGTGSFGTFFSEFLIKNIKFKKLIIFSRDEMKQWNLKNRKPFLDDNRLRFILGDIRDIDRLKRAFEGVDIVVHAAALKIVPSAEHDPMEYVKTNIIGSMNVINASIDKKVSKVIALSTDKASSPINLYGATKLTADKLFINSNSYTGKNKTIFSVVRYGNVFGSRGSIIEKFIKQRKKGILEITDNKMTRFFMTLEDAVNLVLYCLKYMKGSELFVKKNPSISIKKLADIIAPKAKKKIIGLFPGEKIHEEMISYQESRYVIEKKDFYVILTPDKYKKEKNLKKNNLFQYASNSNLDWVPDSKVKIFIENYEKNNPIF